MRSEKNKECIAAIKIEIQKARKSLFVSGSHAQIEKRRREIKLHAMHQYQLRARHWNLVKHNWKYADCRFGRFYYCRQEVYAFIMNANSDDVEKEVVKRVWKMRKELNVTLVEGLCGEIFM